MVKGTTDARVLSDALSLVMERWPSPRVIGHWTPVQRKVAWDWCGAEILAANDNPVRRLPVPEFLKRWT